MSTNYYAVVSDCGSACEHCDKVTRVHLGKSSHGWKFLIRADSDWSVSEVLDNWLLRLSDAKRIENEYGDKVGLGEFLSLVISRQGALSHLRTNKTPGLGILGPAVHEWHGFEFLTQEFS